MQTRETESPLEKMLSQLQVNLSNNIINFNALEKIFIHKEFREPLCSDTSLQNKLFQNYSLAIQMVVDYLVELSRYRFLATPREQIPLSRPTLENAPQYCLMTENFNSIALFAKADILQHTNPIYCLFAIERWAEIMIRLAINQDFNSSFSLYGALDSGIISKFKDKLSLTTVNYMAYMAKNFNMALDKFSVLRDLTVGTSVPMIGIYTGHFSAIKETGDHALSHDPIASKVLNTIFSLQKINAELFGIEQYDTTYLKFQDNTVFSTKAELQDMLRTVAEKNAESPNLLDDPTLLLDSIAKKRISELSLQDNLENNGAYTLLDAFRKKYPVRMTPSQEEYEHYMGLLRTYAASEAKSEAGRKRHTYLTKILNDLSWIPHLPTKIIHINDAIQISDMNGTMLHTQVKKVLLKLAKVIEEKNSVDKHPILLQRAKKLKELEAPNPLSRKHSGSTLNIPTVSPDQYIIPLPTIRIKLVNKNEHFASTVLRKLRFDSVYKTDAPQSLTRQTSKTFQEIVSRDLTRECDLSPSSGESTDDITSDDEVCGRRWKEGIDAITYSREPSSSTPNSSPSATPRSPNSRLSLRKGLSTVIKKLPLQDSMSTDSGSFTFTGNSSDSSTPQDSPTSPVAMKSLSAAKETILRDKERDMIRRDPSISLASPPRNKPASPRLLSQQISLSRPNTPRLSVERTSPPVSHRDIIYEAMSAESLTPVMSTDKNNFDETISSKPESRTRASSVITENEKARKSIKPRTISSANCASENPATMSSTAILNALNSSIASNSSAGSPSTSIQTSPRDSSANLSENHARPRALSKSSFINLKEYRHESDKINDSKIDKQERDDADTLVGYYVRKNRIPPHKPTTNESESKSSVNCDPESPQKRSP